MIYFCIPAYNEERTVGVVLWKLRQVMAELQRDYQIIVVDDASTDSSPAVLSPYIRVMPLTVIRNSERRGYADSLELALREAVRRSPYPKRDAVIVLQADFTEDPDVVATMLKRFEAGADVVATTVEIEADAPRPVRWGRRFMRWLMRRREWSAIGDPVSGLRAYRVVVLKKAIEARGNARLLSYQGAGANVELLWQVLPHSRRSDVTETTLKHHRLQRDARFVFMQALSEVRGAAREKANAKARALPTDSIVATPLPIAQEQPIRRERKPYDNARGQRGGRPERGTRPERPARGERPARTERSSTPAAEQRERPKRAPRPERPKVEKVVPPEVTADAVPIDGEKPVRKKRRRARRRKDKKPQEGAPQLVLEQTEAEPAASESTEPAGDGVAAPKKKSRRGRRGGRGRRRGPKPNNENGEAQSSAEGGEAAPPIAAEGD